MRRLVLVLASAAALLIAAPAGAAPGARYGIQDDAWLLSGPGTLESRLDLLETLGVDLVRYNVRWDEVARRRPARPRAHADPAYDWRSVDPVLKGLHERRIGALVTLIGAPRWANGGRSWQWAPLTAGTFGDFAYATARRYPWVRDWLVWNEPNQARWLRPTSASVYVRRLLNPAYAALHSARGGMRVGGGATAPRGNAGGISPVAWIRGMAAAGARLDAYAHHPYPERPHVETPSSGGCAHCATITMATLERLLAEVSRAFGPKRIWLTEYAYQTNPPDRLVGVSPPAQARFLAEAAHRVFRAPRVDVLIHFLVRDDRELSGWQSGLFSGAGSAKPALRAFQLPLVQAGRRGGAALLWGQVRPRAGRQPYRLRVATGAGWSWLGGTRWTNARGVFEVAVSVPRGARVQLWSARDELHGPVLTLT